MKAVGPSSPRVVIACGGTGGHFFPGSAVGEELREKGVEITLLISSKKVDQQAAHTQEGVDILEIPAVAFSPRQPLRFFSGLLTPLRLLRKRLREKGQNGVSETKNKAIFARIKIALKTNHSSSLKPVFNKSSLDRPSPYGDQILIPLRNPDLIPSFSP